VHGLLANLHCDSGADEVRLQVVERPDDDRPELIAKVRQAA
jgi:hypothetical protein